MLVNEFYSTNIPVDQPNTLNSTTHVHDASLANHLTSIVILVSVIAMVSERSLSDVIGSVYAAE